MRENSHLKPRQPRLNARFLILLLVMTAVLPMAANPDKRSEELFPEREYIKRQSEAFFKKVDTQHPVISRVEFFTSSEAYLTAYMNLTVYISKNNYLEEILPLFAEDNYALLETFSETLEKLKIGNYKVIQNELNMGSLKFYLAVLYALDNEYQRNRLSGGRAFTLWNILLAITENAYRQKENPAQNGAILEVSSHLVFFKQHKKWRKKAKKLAKKTDPDAANDKDIALIRQKKDL